MKSTQLINDLIKDTEEIINYIENNVQGMDDELLRYNPAKNKWNILECIEHMNIADAHYLTQFESKLTPSSRTTENFKPGLLGNYLVKSMKPKPNGSIPSKMQTLKSFRPKGQHNVFEIFLKDQRQLIKHMEQSREIDLNKVRIVSAIGSIIQFKLGDAFRFVTAHNQRHILQIKNNLSFWKEQTVV